MTPLEQALKCIENDYSDKRELESLRLVCGSCEDVIEGYPASFEC